MRFYPKRRFAHHPYPSTTRLLEHNESTQRSDIKEASNYLLLQLEQQRKINLDASKQKEKNRHEKEQGVILDSESSSRLENLVTYNNTVLQLTAAASESLALAIAKEAKRIADEKQQVTTLFATEAFSRNTIESNFFKALLQFQVELTLAKKNEAARLKKALTQLGNTQRKQAIINFTLTEEAERNKIVEAHDAEKMSQEFSNATKRFTIQLGVFRFTNHLYHYNHLLYNRIQYYIHCYNKFHRLIHSAVEKLYQATMPESQATNDCRAFCAVLLKALEDLRDPALNIVSAAHLHNYVYFSSHAFSRLKRRILESACSEDKIPDASNIIKTNLKTIEDFYFYLKALCAETSCPVFENRLENDSPASELVKLTFNLYAYTAIKLYQRGNLDETSRDYIQAGRNFQLACNLAFECLSQIVLRCKKSLCTESAIKFDEKLYAQLKDHVHKMKETWSVFSAKNMTDPNIERDWNECLQDVSSKLFESKRTKAATLRR